MRYALWIDGKYNSPDQAINLTEICNISIWIVQRQTTFTDTIQSQLSYMRAFEKDYGVYLFDLCLTDIVENTMSSKFFADNCRAAQKRYVRVGKMTIKHQDVIRLLGKLRKHDTAAENTGITLVDDP